MAKRYVCFAFVQCEKTGKGVGGGGGWGAYLENIFVGVCIDAVHDGIDGHADHLADPLRTQQSSQQTMARSGETEGIKQTFML